METLRLALCRLKQDLHRVRYAILIIILYCSITQLIFHTVCPFAILTGYACPACGLTRAGILLLTGHFCAAAQYNLMIYLWVALIGYLLIFRYILNRKPPLALFLSSVVCITTLTYYVFRILSGNMVDVPTKGIFFLFFV